VKTTTTTTTTTTCNNNHFPIPAQLRFCKNLDSPPFYYTLLTKLTTHHPAPTSPHTMKVISPNRTTVASFASSSSQQSGFEYDAGDYILSITSPTEDDTSTCVAAALSNHSIIQYDASSGQVVQRIDKAHDKPISEVLFFPREYYGLRNDNTAPSPLLVSASQDGTIKIFDLRCKSTSAAITSKLQLPNEQALSVSLGYGGTLAAVGTNKARISFFDYRYTSGNSPSGNWMGNYVDAHTDEVTQVRFQTVTDPNSRSQKTILATASEDGLLSIHDPSQPSEDAALISILNIGTPLRHFGFFGPSYEGVYVLTGNETMSVWHWDSAQKVSDCGGDGLRGLLSNAVGVNFTNTSDDGEAVEYLIGCEWRAIHASTVVTEPVSPALHLVAGNSQGDGYLFRVDASQITPVVHLKGGHRGCIRDFCWSNGRLITGGEDARICEWDISGSSLSESSNPVGSAASGKVRRSQMKEESRSRNGVRSEAKEKKKFGSPY
jgi:hypothetical protein